MFCEQIKVVSTQGLTSQKPLRTSNLNYAHERMQKCFEFSKFLLA